MDDIKNNSNNDFKVPYPLLSWEEIRYFLIKRKPFIVRYTQINEEVFNMIISRQFEGMPSSFQNEISCWIDGYKQGRPG